MYVSFFSLSRFSFPSASFYLLTLCSAYQCHVSFCSSSSSIFLISPLRSPHPSPFSYLPLSTSLPLPSSLTLLTTAGALSVAAARVSTVDAAWRNWWWYICERRRERRGVMCDERIPWLEAGGEGVARHSADQHSCTTMAGTHTHHGTPHSAPETCLHRRAPGRPVAFNHVTRVWLIR